MLNPAHDSTLSVIRAVGGLNRPIALGPAFESLWPWTISVGTTTRKDPVSVAFDLGLPETRIALVGLRPLELGVTNFLATSQRLRAGSGTRVQSVQLASPRWRNWPRRTHTRLFDLPNTDVGPITLAPVHRDSVLVLDGWPHRVLLAEVAFSFVKPRDVVADHLAEARFTVVCFETTRRGSAHQADGRRTVHDGRVIRISDRGSEDTARGRDEPG